MEINIDYWFSKSFFASGLRFIIIRCISENINIFCMPATCLRSELVNCTGRRFCCGNRFVRVQILQICIKMFLTKIMSTFFFLTTIELSRHSVPLFSFPVGCPLVVGLLPRQSFCRGGGLGVCNERQAVILARGNSTTKSS